MSYLAQSRLLQCHRHDSARLFCTAQPVIHAPRAFGRAMSCGRKFSASVVNAATAKRNSSGRYTCEQQLCCLAACHAVLQPLPISTAYLPERTCNPGTAYSPQSQAWFPRICQEVLSRLLAHHLQLSLPHKVAITSRTPLQLNTSSAQPSWHSQHADSTDLQESYPLVRPGSTLAPTALGTHLAQDVKL